MDFENDCSQSQSKPCIQNSLLYTPQHTQCSYSVPPNTVNHTQCQNSKNQFGIEGTNLMNQQSIVVDQTLLQQPILQMEIQQFFKQQQELNDDDHDQDYKPEEDQESGSTSSDEYLDDIQEEEQFDDPDFDLQAYLKVRDQL